MTRTAQQIATLLGVSTAGSAMLRRVSAPGDADAGSIVFAQDDAALEAALASGAGLILARRGNLVVADDRVLWVKDPKYCFAVCARELTPPVLGSEVHPAAFVDPTAKLGERVRIGAHAVVEAGATLGDDVVLGSGTIVLRGVQIGHRVIVQAGAVLGSTGFGYVRNPENGEYLLFPQQGRLVVEDDVEIGANTTIDRGALGETRIGRGTKIDNLVQVGHNCSIGCNVVIAAQVGISGSCVIEDGAVLAGQVGLGDHCHIGPGVILGGQSGVYPGKSVVGPGEVLAGTPAEPVRDHMKALARIRRLK